MTLNWLDRPFSLLADRVGDRNPQLFRELKGRRKPRSVMFAIAVALLAQFLLLLYFWAQLPDTETFHTDSLYFNHYYCVAGNKYTGYTGCSIDSSGHVAIDWQLWWRDIFRVLNWGLMLLVMIPGAYLLVADIEQEEQRGTLNFIRLSPQSSRSVLVGKLLGTPILLYLGALLFLPLHLFVAHQLAVPAVFLMSYYGLLTLGCGLLYSAALLCGFLGKRLFAGGKLALVVVLLTTFGFLPLFSFWNVATSWHAFADYFLSRPPVESIDWFFLPISQRIADGKDLTIANAFTAVNLVLLTYWVWQALQRCFHVPHATLLSKRQSYGLVAYLEILLLGFCLQSWAGIDTKFESFSWDMLSLVICLNLLLFLALIAVLSNHSQTLLDWARYRHFSQRSNQRSWRSSLKEVLFAEKSPAIGAILLNLLIFAAVFLPWVYFWSSRYSSARTAVWGLLMTISLVAVYAAIVQLTLLMKTPKRTFWTIGVLAVVMIVPSIAGAVLMSISSGTASAIGELLLLSSPLFWTLLNGGNSLFSVFLAIVGQGLAFTLLRLRLKQQLHQLGESASRQLLSSGSLRGRQA